jgi:integrase
VKVTKRQREPGTWELRYTYRDPATHRRRYPSKTVHGSERQAEKARKELERSLAEESNERGTALTVGDLLDRWMDHVADDYSPTTVREFRGFIRARLRPALGDYQLRRFGPEHLDTYYRALTRGEGLAPATARKAHSIMHLALAQGVRWGWIPENVAAKASPPRLGHHEITPPAPEAILRLLETARTTHPDLYAFLRLTAATGARRGEVCALRLPQLAWLAEPVNVDGVLIGGAVTIQGAVVALPGGEVLLKDTKTHRSRQVALGADTMAVAAEQVERARERARAGFVDLAPNAFLFSFDPAGREPWRPNYVTRRFIRLRDQLGLDGLRLHDIRHFATTQLLAAGIDVKTVSSRHGWANATMPLNRYGHFVAAADARAAAVMDRVLTPTDAKKPRPLPPAEGATSAAGEAS